LKEDACEYAKVIKFLYDKVKKKYNK